MPMFGFGTGSFGTMPFGTASEDAVPLAVLSVLAVRENVVRVRFNVAPRYTQLLDPNDASDPRRFTMTPVAGTMGRDGESTRAVTPIAVARDDAEGTVLDIWLDRPMSPEPCRYVLAIEGLVAAETLDPMATQQFELLALFKGLVTPTPEFIINNRDIANPQTMAGIFDPLPIEQGQDLDALLGTFREDSQGDIAFDEGLAGFKKRVMRRLTTKKGRFSHLKNYGVSTIASVKMLSRAGLREFLADEAEDQIRQEPETVDVSVSIVVDDARPDMARYQVRIKSSFGELPEFALPVSASSTGSS